MTENISFIAGNVFGVASIVFLLLDFYVFFSVCFVLTLSWIALYLYTVYRSI